MCFFVTHCRYVIASVPVPKLLLKVCFRSLLKNLKPHRKVLYAVLNKRDLRSAKCWGDKFDNVSHFLSLCVCSKNFLIFTNFLALFSSHFCFFQRLAHFRILLYKLKMNCGCFSDKIDNNIIFFLFGWIFMQEYLVRKVTSWRQLFAFLFDT